MLSYAPKFKREIYRSHSGLARVIRQGRIAVEADGGLCTGRMDGSRFTARSRLGRVPQRRGNVRKALGG